MTPAAQLVGLVARAAEVRDLPGADQAREAARRELARTPYQQAKPSFARRALIYLYEHVVDLLDRAGATLPGGRTGVLLLLLVVLGLVAVVVVRLRPSLRQARTDALFALDADLTAAQHRSRADDAAGRGEHAVAVRERLRAVVRELEERGVLDPRPGRTADEVAREAGALVPSVAAPLRRGVTVFDEVWYGGRTADAASYAVLVEVDATVTGARLVVA